MRSAVPPPPTPRYRVPFPHRCPRADGNVRPIICLGPSFPTFVGGTEILRQVLTDVPSIISKSTEVTNSKIP